MPDLSLDGLVKAASENAKKTLLEGKQDGLQPLIHLVTRDGSGEVIMALWQNETEKYMMMDMIRHRAHEINAKAVLFMHEAWLASMDAGNAFMRPSESPTRIECVVICATDGTHSRSMVYEIIRNDRGKIMELRDYGIKGTELKANILDGIITTTH